MTPKGPFDLARSREFFGGWPSPPSDAEAIVMAFPVEGWRTSAAVVVSQPRGGRIVGDIYGAGADAAKAWRQALATLSLDVDGRSYGALGRRDTVIRELRKRDGLMRPTLFSSPYEAATHSFSRTAGPSRNRGRHGPPWPWSTAIGSRSKAARSTRFPGHRWYASCAPLVDWTRSDWCDFAGSPTRRSMERSIEDDCGDFRSSAP